MDEGLLPAAARTQELEKEDEDPERSTKCRRPRLRVVVMLATLLTSSSALLYLALCQCFSLSCCARRSGSVVVRRWPSVKDLNCSRLFTDKRYALAVGRKRITLKDPKQLHLNCGTVRARWLFAKRPTSREEARYPIAYARIVYKVIVCEVFFGQIDCFQDYLFLEQLLAVEYQPQNYYCYVLDSKASPEFKRRIRNLSKCFRNVIVPTTEFSVFSNGKNVSRGHLECLKALVPYKWNYVFLLQNHDIPMRTNLEKVRILKIHNGANAVSTTFIAPWTADRKMDWSLQHLQMFDNPSRNVPGIQIRHTKSLVQVALTHKSVSYILRELRPEGFIDQLETVRYGMDENFMSTLNSNEVLGVPGGFTTKCLEEGLEEENLIRRSFWMGNPGCVSQVYRHHICILGVEDLAHLRSLPHVYINKMMPEFDFGAASCWLERISTKIWCM
ncbi:core-2/I-Branching enzyme family protein [Aphelenchoides avenae]|nr:core-2/I-Branching enzyme family protein [Aphelenchus avenae]